VVTANRLAIEPFESKSDRLGSVAVKQPLIAGRPHQVIRFAPSIVIVFEAAFLIG